MSTMKNTRGFLRMILRAARGLSLVAIAFALVSPRFASGAPEQTTKAPAAPAVKQKVFPSPNEAATALIDAAARFDVPALTEILGPDGVDLFSTEDPVQDKKAADAFAKRGLEKHSVVTDKKNPNRAILYIGDEDWPSPVPIVRVKSGWRFDSKAGRKEILYRRVGSNELDAIQMCRGYVEAQHEYASKKHDGSPINQYAQRTISTPGKQDGLAWRNADGTWGGPVGEYIAKVIEEGYSDKAKPYHGYYFKILKGQGPAAPMGQMDYVVEGVMIGGFAFVAAPADYRVTGVKTFIVGYDGVVYQKDLGEKTLDAFKTMERYNPDKTWQVVPGD